MARFYGTLQGNKGGVSRCGTSSSGLQTNTAGWDVGIVVNAYVNDEGEDEFCVTLTSGSRGKKMSKTIGNYTAKDL